ncbi:hypothetical protein PGT21_022803 [Puccinia graminis f. sp. tritici]|uniref:Uncharacterized protein n=1 Tax=Puccinia graminis f. sp. tritici TaxID=56615 RepID=A0A5B0M401_PUCGR|nr:hypothetical protein PGT21_022803 [Puccinia graminis f. sp. tritici]
MGLINLKPIAPILARDSSQLTGTQSGPNIQLNLGLIRLPIEKKTLGRSGIHRGRLIGRDSSLVLSISMIDPSTLPSTSIRAEKNALSIPVMSFVHFRSVRCYLDF